MSKISPNWLKAALFVMLGSAGALPALPSAQTVSTAVKEALTVAAPAPASQSPQGQTARADVSTVVSQPVAVARTGRSVVARATAYNSFAAQTDSTPHITATGTRTRPGVIALSRDLLRVFPYGTRVTIQDLSGRYNFAGQVFIVEDTMAARKTNSVDIWMATYRQAMNFGARQVRITALR